MDSPQYRHTRVSGMMASCLRRNLRERLKRYVKERTSGGSSLTGRKVFHKEMMSLEIADLCNPLEVYQGIPAAESIGTGIGRRMLTFDSKEVEGSCVRGGISRIWVHSGPSFSFHTQRFWMGKPGVVSRNMLIGDE